MTAVDDYMRQLDAALHVRGRARRGLLAESCSHLTDAAALHGCQDAVHRFGDVQTPLADLGAVLGRSAHTSTGAGSSRSIVLLAPALILAATAALVWDHQDHGTLAKSAAAAGIEAALTIVGFVVLGRVLGLRPARRTRRGGAST